MQSVKQQTMNLVHDYQSAVHRAVALLNAKAEQEKGFQQHEERPGCRAGYLDEDKQVRYAFHGAGCFVIMPEFKVDFDYAKEGGCTGIDAWFLFDFLESNPAIWAKYPLLRSEEHVEQGLEELVEEGLLTQYVYSDDDNRYYVTADLWNSHPPRVRLYWPDEDVSL